MREKHVGSSTSSMLFVFFKAKVYFCLDNAFSLLQCFSIDYKSTKHHILLNMHSVIFGIIL